LRLKIRFSKLGEREYHFCWCEKPWRSRGENRSEAEFESAIERVFKVVAEAVIFIYKWGVKYAFMFRELEDGSKELSYQCELAGVEGRDANFGT